MPRDARQTRPHPPRPAPAGTPRRAFALPLVLLLTLTASVVIMGMMVNAERARSAGQKYVNGYLDHHFQAGLRDMVETSIRMRGINPLEIWGDRPGRLALSVEGGVRLEIELRDAQGTILWDATQSAGPVMLRAAAEMFRAEPGRAASLLRARGPARVSLNSADRLVIESILRVIDPECKPDDVVSALAQRRLDGKKVTPGEVAGFINMSGMKPELAPLAAAQFTTEPGLWWVRVITRDRQGQELQRHRGLLMGDGRSTSPMAFLTWEKVDPAAESADPVAGLAGPGGGPAPRGGSR